MMSMPGPLELVVIFMVVLVIFGPKQITGIAKGLGEGIKEFKKAVGPDEKDRG